MRNKWNNWDLRYYTSYNSDCVERCGWANSPSDPHRSEIETLYYGYYSLLSSVNDVLTAIRKNGVDLGGQQATKMHEAVAVMLQAVVFANIALDYDQGFVVTEKTDLSNPQALPFVSRQVLRDSALAKFNQAIALMQATTFTTPGMPATLASSTPTSVAPTAGGRTTAPWSIPGTRTF